MDNTKVKKSAKVDRDTSLSQAFRAHETAERKAREALRDAREAEFALKIELLRLGNPDLFKIDKTRLRHYMDYREKQENVSCLLCHDSGQYNMEPCPNCQG